MVVEWNLAGISLTAAGMWDTHWQWLARIELCNSRRTAPKVPVNGLICQVSIRSAKTNLMLQRIDFFPNSQPIDSATISLGFLLLILEPAQNPEQLVFRVLQVNSEVKSD